MKENRKLLKEVLRDVQKDMTDEEVLALLADSRVSVNPAEEKAFIVGTGDKQPTWCCGWSSTRCWQPALLIRIRSSC